MLLSFIDDSIKFYTNDDIRIKLKLLKKFVMMQNDYFMLYNHIKFIENTYDKKLEMILSKELKQYILDEYKKYKNNIK